MNKYFKKFSTSQKGFTIIELIVVIAIIAVLAAIVLVGITSYLSKGKDSAIKSNMNTILKNGAIYYEIHGSYLGTGFYFCVDPMVDVPVVAIANAGGFSRHRVLCYAAADSWCTCTPLIGGSDDTFCVDSTGYEKEVESTDCGNRCHSGAEYCTDS